MSQLQFAIYNWIYVWCAGMTTMWPNQRQGDNSSLHMFCRQSNKNWWPFTITNHHPQSFIIIYYLQPAPLFLEQYAHVLPAIKQQLVILSYPILSSIIIIKNCGDTTIHYSSSTIIHCHLSPIIFNFHIHLEQHPITKTGHRLSKCQ